MRALMMLPMLAALSLAGCGAEDKPEADKSNSEAPKADAGKSGDSSTAESSTGDLDSGDAAVVKVKLPNMV